METTGGATRSALTTSFEMFVENGKLRLCIGWVGPSYHNFHEIRLDGFSELCLRELASP